MSDLARHMSSPTKDGRLLDQIGGGLFVLLAVLPILFAILFALAYGLGLFGYFSKGFTTAHFMAVATGGEIIPAFLLSAYVAATTTLFTVGIGLWGALYLRRDLRTGPFSMLIYVPLILPSAVAGFSVWLLLGGAGLMSRLAFAVGLTTGSADFPALVNDPFAIGIIAAHVGIGAPFFMILFAQISQKEKTDRLASLSRALGASPAQALLKIVIPVLLFRARAQVVLSFIFVFGSFEIPAILGSHSSEMISVQAVRKLGMLELSQRPEAYVIACLYSLVVVLAVLFLMRSKPRPGPEQS